MILNEWMKKKYENKNICEYLVKENMRRVAVYGMADLGKRLCDELTENGIEVCYGIDKSVEGCYKGIKIKKLTDKLEEVDVIVVTVFTSAAKIEKDIRKSVDYPVISIEKLLYDYKADEVK